MDNKDKHNIFSKEELFKLIDEKRSLPPDADDFDKEALEGLAMVKDRKKLDSLNDSIDEVLRKEEAKAKKKRTIYFLSAAASLILIVGMFFLLKDNMAMKEDSAVAQSNPEKTEDIMSGKEQSPGEPVTESSGDDKTTVVAAKGPERKEAEKIGKLTDGEGKSNNVPPTPPVNVPPAEAMNNISLAENDRSNKNMNGEALDREDANLADKKAGAKSQADDQFVAGLETQKGKKEEAKKVDEKKLSKEKEADTKKVYYETNTIWPSATGAVDKDKVADELKQKQEPVTDTKPVVVNEDSRDQSTVASGNVVTTSNTSPAQTLEETGVSGGKDMDVTKYDGPAKNMEVAQKVENGAFYKKHRAKSRKTRAAAYDTGDSEKKPGYAQTTAKPDKPKPEFTGGEKALQSFVKSNLKISAPGNKGTIVTEFTIQKDGSVDTSGIKITKGIKKCDPCNEDVKRMVKKMPKWQPATEKGQPKEYRQKMEVDYEATESKK